MAFACGLGAGVIQAGLFNPYDRALFLSVRDKSPFLHADNFRRPYQGFLQSVGGRAISGGLFFPLESVIRSLSGGHHGDDDAAAASNFLVGSAAGIVNALVLNPLSAIKYRTWGKEKDRNMMQEALHMWKKGGINPFFHGCLPTVARDVAFGGTYTFLRCHLKDADWTSQESQWFFNMGAAAIATVVSGPFNLARNIQYSASTTAERSSIGTILANLWNNALQREGVFSRLSYLQSRLRIGWGTARVAAGMALGQQVYDTLFSVATASPNFTC